MRYTELLEEEMQWVKLWLNAATGEAVFIDIYESHETALRADPAKYGLTHEDVGDDDEYNMMAKALANGWVRIANFNDATLVGVPVDETGYVNADTIPDVRKGLAWLRKNHLLPAAISIELHYGGPHRLLKDREIDDFIRSGNLKH